MKSALYIVIIIAGLWGCKSAIHQQYATLEPPKREKVVKDTIEKPVILTATVQRDSIPKIASPTYRYWPKETVKFKLNGGCIYTSIRNGSESGSIHFQWKGNYLKSANKIEVLFNEIRSIGSRRLLAGGKLKDKDWQDMRDVKRNYVTNAKKDSIWVVGYLGIEHFRYIKD